MVGSIGDRQVLEVNGQRLLQRLWDLAEIGPIPGGGNNRLALTDADKEGRDLVVTWMRDLGLDVSIDTIGNVVAAQPDVGRGPPVMMGSHIDTVATGGKYDGNLGVLAALEVIETAIESGIDLERPLAAAFFTNEEGSRFPPDMMGSLCYTGGLTVEEAMSTTDANGVAVGDELDRIGYRGPVPCPGPAPYAFVELHIEQGPVLERDGMRIGAVTGVQGISWTEVNITGQSNHAGTTPMSMRRDAGLAAGELVVAVRRIADEMGGTQVGTVGALRLHPDLVNVVAARAQLIIDLRNTDDDDLQSAERRLLTEVKRIADSEDVEIDTKWVARFEPVVFDPRVVELVESNASALGLSVRRMPSGAGHDAQILAAVCPAGMVFVPSVKGISHNPAEYTEPDDLIAGANVLLNTVVTLATEGV
ncbi:MAG: Zn-dependent hydrolase [Acidimicrobiaceae bacterium]|nr:Zn-dependent hydrolase [Acidimicrobiaceae bacterium]MDE0515245.1 Zn-dependent hydrolase [Acidimicrobiaceae bacterium]MDE0656299.1 Zn-dependent hydrolase [Acidimicrobiaceae bacterium]MXZ96684.1 Zn-dependent hydrolase [Acidimicrobiaceae bacterium]MYF42726.1 Zn-dependent hydrolase [Acidimicrobiaceae bacterium]